MSNITEFVIVNNVVNDKVVHYFQWIMFAGICLIIGVFGVKTNIINIMCFVKQGFKDPVNLSLLGLTVSDMGCLMTISWTNVCCIPAVSSADLQFEPLELQYLTGAVPHSTFTRITAWITALITLERCLCITAPLKVNNIITSKRVSVTIICVFVIFMSSVSPVYTVNKLGMKYFPHRNKTVIGLIYAEDRAQVESISFVVNNVIVPFAAFLIIIVCTLILVIKLKEKMKWRKTSASCEQAETLSRRDQKVARMVVVISALFIACFTPLSIFFLAMSFVPGLSLDGPYRNVTVILAMVVIFMESINSSMNIFIYYNMSSKYRLAFREIFSKRFKLN